MNNDAGLGGNSVIASGKGGGFYLEQSTLELSGDDFEKHLLPFVLRWVSKNLSVPLILNHSKLLINNLEKSNYLVNVSELLICL